MDASPSQALPDLSKEEYYNLCELLIMTGWNHRFANYTRSHHRGRQPYHKVHGIRNLNVDGATSRYYFPFIGSRRDLISFEGPYAFDTED